MGVRSSYHAGMRYPPERKEQTRQSILAAAGRVFRRVGYAAAGVDAIMAEAGLTPGGFYAHFASKEALFAELVPHALRQTVLGGGVPSPEDSDPEWLLGLVARYLSLGHCSEVEKGCPLPPLLADISRSGPDARAAFEGMLRESLERMQTHLPAGTPAVALLALLVGGMTLARACAETTFAEEILAACREFARHAFTPEEES
jgi:TetR/AcrR family transcriptional repressor of nem operon